MGAQDPGDGIAPSGSSSLLPSSFSALAGNGTSGTGVKKRFHNFHATTGPHAAGVLVSVVIPTKDRLALLREAIASVRRAAELIESEVDLIVIDDGTPGVTIEAMESLGVRAMPNPRRGVSAARNYGVHNAKGELIAFLDDDDVWEPEHLAFHLAAHERQPVVASYSQGRLADESLNPIEPAYPVGPLPQGDVLKFVLTGKLQPVSSIVVRRDAFLAIGGFDESLWTGEDMDFVERLAAQGPFAAIHKPTVRWRQHSMNGLGGSYRRWLARKRQGRANIERSLGRAKEAGLPRIRLLDRRFEHRGWMVHEGLQEAYRCIAHGDRGDAAKLLAAVWLESPPHVIKQLPRYGRLAVGLLKNSSLPG